MTREQYMEYRLAALQSMKTNIETYRKNPQLPPDMRDEFERGYEAILQKQAEWERNGFWTEDNEKRFAEFNRKMN